jgi:uncharacterized membrane protein YeaQ/YmgE (transglycosylase-associated protein family)
MLELIISLVAGALGGNVAGKLLKQFDLGMLWNSVAGVAGGGIGASIIAALLGSAAPDAAIASDAAISIPGLINALASGGVGGAVLLVIVGLIKKALGKA